MHAIPIFLMHVSLIGAFALTAGCACIVWKRPIVLVATELMDRWKRIGNLGRVLLFTFVTAMIVYGSTKTNATCGVAGGTTNAPTMMGTVLGGSLGHGPYGIVQPEAGRVPTGATLAQNWWRRGCWEDWRSVSFDGDWVFPSGTDHLSKVAVISQGAIRPTVRSEDIASLGLKVAQVPFDTCFYHEHTPSNSYRFTWDRAYIDRNTNTPMFATVELFRNGDISISTNGVSTFTPREIPFPHVGIGQNDDWVQTNFVNAAEILAVGYANWVNDQVGVDLENGLYKFTATFPDDPPEATQLTVGELSVVITNAGEYVFVLEKGVEYTFGTTPYDATVEYSMQDDVGPDAEIIYPAFPILNSPFSILHFPFATGIWTIDGNGRDFCWQTLSYLGYCFWEPKFRGSPDVTDLSTADFPMTFTAVFDNAHTNAVAYHWTTEDEKIYIESPYSQTTRVEIDSPFDVDTFSLTVEAHVTNRTYQSKLLATVSTNDQSGLSLSMPDALFTNDDDDDGDGASDHRPDTTNEDDIVCATVTVPVAESGVLSLVGVDSFIGDVWERTSEGCATVLAGANWRIEASNPDRTKDLYFDAYSASAGYRRASTSFRWTPDVGRTRDLTHRFTVVAPIVEPICRMTTNVVENGVARKLTVNPCGVGIGRDAYFRVEVKPKTFPDSKIVWTAEGDGSVSFPNGNTGRDVMVRGLGSGDVELRIQIGDSCSITPTFPLRVVTNKVVKLSAWILSDKTGVPVRNVDAVRNLVKEAEDIYAQVGVTFDLAERISVTNMSGRTLIARGGEGPNMIAFADLVNSARGTGGLELYFVEAFYNVTNGNVTLSSAAGVNRPEGLAIARSANALVLAHEIGHAFGLDDIYENMGGLTDCGIAHVCFDNMPFDWNGGCHGKDEGGARYYSKGLMLQQAIQRLLMNGEPTVSDPGADISAGYVQGLLYGSDHGADVWGLANIGFFIPKAREPVHQ